MWPLTVDVAVDSAAPPTLRREVDFWGACTSATTGRLPAGCSSSPTCAPTRSAAPGRLLRSSTDYITRRRKQHHRSPYLSVWSGVSGSLHLPGRGHSSSPPTCFSERNTNIFSDFFTPCCVADALSLVWILQSLPLSSFFCQHGLM